MILEGVPERQSLSAHQAAEQLLSIEKMTAPGEWDK
jgi:hypothetical protein